MAPNIGPLLQELPTLFTEREAAKAKGTLQRSRPDNRQDSSDSTGIQESLYEGLKKLDEAGDIDIQDGDTKLLEMLAEGTKKKEEMLETIQNFKSKFPRPEKIVGRGKDMEKIHRFLSDVRVPGVNLFGKSGVGKTTIAKEVSNQMKGFVTLPIDVRGTQDINSVYFKVLEAFNLAKSDYYKERIYTHLQNLTSNTLLFLDNVEQFMSKESEADQVTRRKFLEFLKAIILSAACKNGHLKVLLTSRIQIDEPGFKHARFVEYKLEAFSEKDSEDFIRRRVKDVDSDNMREEAEAAKKIPKLCKHRIYLLREAEQLKRAHRSTSVQVLEKITAQIEKRVPKKFACISALFESLPSDHLKQVAVKISLLHRPFSVSTAMKIIEMSSEFDAEWDLEMLVSQKIITAEDVNGERKYDVHECFREFVTLYLCKEHLVYQEHVNKGKEKFAEHFSEDLIKLSGKLENDFVRMFAMLEENRPNFEKTIDIIIENASFDLLFYSDDLKKAGLLSMFFEYVVNNQKRKELFKSWAESSEKKGNLLISAYIKCWEALLSADMEGTSCGFKTLNQATLLLDRVDSTSSNQVLFGMVQGMYRFCRGHLRYKECENLTDQSSSRTKKMTKTLLQEALSDLQKSLDIHQKVYGDHSLTARSLDLMGNCYMLQFEPEKAESIYQEAMDMKMKLVGSEKHDGIVHFYNQLSQAHQMMGDNIMKGPFDLKKVMGPLLPYQRKAKKQYELAAELLIVALDLQEKLGVCDTEDTATFQRNLANLYVALKKYDEALDYAKKSYETRYRLLKEHPETVRILYLIGIINEYRKDHKAALKSYEEAFAMEESLPEDNHSVVRKLLCGRLEAMCKKLNKRNELKKYGPRIKEIMQIKSTPFVTQEPAAAQVLPTTGGRDDHPETAEEATEEDVPDHPIQGDIPEETPLSYNEPGIADTEHPVQEDLPDVPLPADDTPVTPTEPGIAATEHPVQEDLPDVPLQPDDTPVTPTEPGITDTEHMPPVQEDLSDVQLPPDDAPVTPTEPGIADTEPVQEDLGIPDVTGIIDEIPPQCITINPEGGSLDIPMIGICLDIPPNTVTQATTVICRKYTEESLPVTSPAGKGETVVSYIVGLEPSTVHLNKPIIVSLMHSGPGKGYGYETIVKAFNQENETWQMPKVLDRRQVKVSAHCRKDFIQVQISKLTILAVVTRLFTDRFQVTPKGCVVRSSVCDDVTIEFPEGAVDKTVEGSVKVMLVDTNIRKEEKGYPFPILCVDGFDRVQFQKLPTIKLSQPSLETYSESKICVLCLEDSKTQGEPESQWTDITEQIHIEESEYFIQLHVTHFSWLSVWKWIDIPPITYVSSVYNYLCSPPREVCFAAFKDKVDSFDNFKLKLLCVDNIRLHSIKEEKGYSELSPETGDGKMRRDDKAYVEIKGDFRQEFAKPFYLRFLGDRECEKGVYVRKREGIDKGGDEVLNVLFHAENQERGLCELCYKAKDIPSTSTRSIRVTPNLNLSDEQNKWIVIGICLNKTILPPLRDFLEKEINIHYSDLKTKHSIHNQNHKKHLTNDGKQLHYKSINNNATKKKTYDYDYNVTSAEDLGKLYLMPYMAKFTGFDDTCDMSAVLGILSSASVFSPDVQKLAKDVKNDVRNEWAHCNFQEWKKAKFTSCFQLMKSLVQALKLPLDKEKQITDELGEWESKDIDGGALNKFIKFAEVEFKRLSQEVNLLEASQKEEYEKLAATLHHILKILDQNKKDQEEKLEDMDKRVTALEQNQECSDKKIEVLEEKQESDVKRIETVEQKVKDITSSTDKEPVECFGILITERDFKDLPFLILPSMMPFANIEVYEMPGMEKGPWNPEDFLRNFTKNADKPRSACLRHLLVVLQAKPTEENSEPDFSVSMSHVIDLLIVGKELVTTPLRENQELKEKTIEIVSRNLNSNLNYCWETLAGHLEVDEEIVKRCREDYSGDTPEVTSQMLKQWIETTDKCCTLEVIFDALRLCGYKDTGIKLATHTTAECRSKLHR